LCIEKSKGTAKRKPRQSRGLRFSRCLLASVMAWPLMFSIAATAQGMGCATPTPSDIATGIGRQHVRRVVFAGDGAVADHGPAGGADDLHVQPVLR
jgi:hypothetical protein